MEDTKEWFDSREVNENTSPQRNVGGPRKNLKRQNQDLDG